MNPIAVVPTTQMHTMSPNMTHGPPPGVMNPQMQYQNNPNAPVLIVRHAGPRSHARSPDPPMGRRLPGQFGPQQRPDGMGGSMLPPSGQAGTNGPPKPGSKRGQGGMNPGDLRTPGALYNNSPAMNPQPPPFASPVPTPPPLAQAVSMPDPRFNFSEKIANSDGDFDFPGSLGYGTYPGGTSLETTQSAEHSLLIGRR